jgi:hypothetical protein
MLGIFTCFYERNKPICMPGIQDSLCKRVWLGGAWSAYAWFVRNFRKTNSIPWTSCVFECVLAYPVPPFLHIPIAAIADLHKLILILRCGSTRATFWPTLTCRGTGEGHRLDALKPTEQGFNLLNRSFSITFGVVNVVGLRRIFYIDTFGAAFRGILCHFESWLGLQLKHSWSVPL